MSQAQDVVRCGLTPDLNARAIEVPLSVIRACAVAVPLAERAARDGNKNSVSDAGVAALCLRTAAHGAYLNVMINMAGLSDKPAGERLAKEAGALYKQVDGAVSEIVAGVEKSFGA